MGAGGEGTSFFSQAAAKALPMIVMGIVVRMTPQMSAAAIRNLERVRVRVRVRGRGRGSVTGVPSAAARIGKSSAKTQHGTWLGLGLVLGLG